MGTTVPVGRVACQTADERGDRRRGLARARGTDDEKRATERWPARDPLLYGVEPRDRDGAGFTQCRCHAIHASRCH